MTSNSNKHPISRRHFLGGLSAVAAGVMMGRQSMAHWAPPTLSWDEWARHDALGLADLVKSGEVSPLDVAEQVQHAVHKLNPQINAVVEFYYDKLMPGASDDLPAGIFHGAPYFFKDVGDVEKGRVGEESSRALMGRVVEEESAYVANIRQSGLNFLGRTTAPEFGTALPTESLMNGVTCNPWDLSYTPGGSSGGAGAVVAAGILPMSASNDGGGSTRLPASICGNVGLKYTREVAATIKGGAEPLALDSMGVNTRTVRDQAAFLDAALDPEKTNADPGGKGSHLAALREKVRPLKIALSTTRWGPYEATPDSIAEMQRIAGVLRDLGHTVDEADADIDYHAFYRAFRVFWSSPPSSRVPPEQASLPDPFPFDGNPLLEPITRKIFESGKRWTWDDYQWAVETNRSMTAAVDGFLDDWDLWLMPAMGTHTPKIGSNLALFNGEQSIEEWWFNTWAALPFTPLFNFTGHPAISVPVANFASGMPLGAHFAAADNREALLLQVAAQLEEALPWFDKHPPVHVTNI